MAKTYDLLITARGETRDAQRAIAQLQKRVDRFGRNMRNVGAGMTAGFTLPLLALGRMGVSELGAIEKANAQTALVIEKLGKNSRVTAASITSMAAALQEKSGIDDQSIQSAQNLILRLSNLDVTTRQGEKSFKTATAAVVGFADSMSVDVETAGRMFAKTIAAANQGAITLPKGVKLGEDAMKRLKTVFDGNSTAAQRQAAVIKELNAQFGDGMDLTNADKWNVAMDKLAGSAASLVVLLIPAFTKLTRIVGAATAWFDQLSASGRRIVGAGLLIAGVMGPVLIILGSLISAASALVPVLAAISLPVLGVVAGIAALGVALVVAYTKSERFRDVVNRSFRAVASGVRQVLSELQKTISVWVGWGRNIWSKWGDDIMRVVRPAMNLVRGLIVNNLTTIRDGVQVILAAIRGDWGTAWDKLKDIVRNKLAAAKSVVTNYKALFVAAVKLYATAYKGLIGAFVSAGKAIGKALIDAIIDAVKSGAKRIGKAAGDAARAAASAAQGAIADMFRSGPGRKGGAGKTMSGVSALGALFGNNLTMQDVIGYISNSTSAVYGFDENGAVTTNTAAKKFIESRKAANEKRLATLINLRNATVNKLTSARKALLNANRALGIAKKGRDPKKISNARKAVAEQKKRVGGLEGKIQYLNDEILDIGGQINADAEALEPPDPITDNDTDTSDGGSSGSTDDLGGGSSGGGSGTGGGSSTGGSSPTPPVDVQGSVPGQELMPTSVSASGAVSSAALRALTGNGNVFNITGSDPEAIAARVAWILGSSRMYAGGGI